MKPVATESTISPESSLPISPPVDSDESIASSDPIRDTILASVLLV